MENHANESGHHYQCSVHRRELLEGDKSPGRAREFRLKGNHYHYSYVGLSREGIRIIRQKQGYPTFPSAENLEELHYCNSFTPHL